MSRFTCPGALVAVTDRFMTRLESDSCLGYTGVVFIVVDRFESLVSYTAGSSRRAAQLRNWELKPSGEVVQALSVRGIELYSTHSGTPRDEASLPRSLYLLRLCCPATYTESMQVNTWFIYLLFGPFFVRCLLHLSLVCSCDRLQFRYPMLFIWNHLQLEKPQRHL